jgi:hypothetical protein
MQKGALIKVHILILLWRDYVDNEFFLLCVYEYNGLIVTWKTFFLFHGYFVQLFCQKLVSQNLILFYLMWSFFFLYV